MIDGISPIPMQWLTFDLKMNLNTLKHHITAFDSLSDFKGWTFKKEIMIRIQGGQSFSLLFF